MASSPEISNCCVFNHALCLQRPKANLGLVRKGKAERREVNEQRT